MSRYNRHTILNEIGQQGQALLKNAGVLVVGAGGLGCPALQYLAAAGIGRLGIVDFDVVEESNLQRQILFGTTTLGMNKAIAAKKRLEDLNPTICIKTYPFRLTAQNALELFEAYDIIVDGSDNFTTRYLVNDAAIFANKPVVYGAIYKFEGQVSVFNYRNGPSYRCLFPKPPKAGSVANCSEAGVLGVLPGIIGTMQANEVIKIILGFDHVLSGKLLCYDAKTATMMTLTVARSHSEYKKIHARKDHFETVDPEVDCEVTIPEISVEEAFGIENAFFIDLREPNEEPAIEFPNCSRMPLSTINDQLDRMNTEKIYILFCQSGIRSKSAVQLLQQHAIHRCFSLKGGAQAIFNQIKIESELDSTKR